MLHRKPINPPEYIYPTDPWRMVEKEFSPRFLAQMETIFSTSNGYLGMRGVFEEGTPVCQNGTFINGFYESWPIVYPEEAYGFAKTGQTIVNVPDSKLIKLYVDDEPFYLPTAHLLSFERALDMRAGTLEREVLWETPSGKRVAIKSRRLVSFEYRHLAAIAYEVTVLNAKAPVDISSEMRNQEPTEEVDDNDPRRAQRFKERVLLPKLNWVKDYRIMLGHSTKSSQMSLVCGIDHTLETECPYSYKSKCEEDGGKVVFSIDAQPGVPIKLVKYMAYHTSRSVIVEELGERAERTLDRAIAHGFEELVTLQREYLDDFWRRALSSRL